jgi:prevent-host-death family protein
MISFSANDAKQRFGQVIDTALQQPVAITKHNRRSVVIVSDAEYRALCELRQDALQQQVRAGFEQLDSGKTASRTPKQIAASVRREFERGEL